MADLTRVVVDGNEMEIYLDRPATAAPWPAVVLTYHREGIDDFTKWIARRYAEAGYLVAVPEVSHRMPSSVPPRDRKQYLKDTEIVADIRATVAYLKGRPDVASSRLAIAGHCMGGHMLFLAACAMPDFKCAVACYPTGMFESWGGPGPTPFDRLGELKCPVIGLFGNEDRNPSPDDANRLDAALSKHGIEHVFYRYPGARHGFHRPSVDNPATRAAQAHSWQQIFAFLAQKLASVAAET